MKKHLFYIFAVIIFVMVFSCHHDNVEIKKPSQTPCDSFELGTVDIAVDSTLSIEQVFANLNQYPDVTINEIQGFYFISNLPKDNLNYISSYLKQLPYLNQRGFSPNVSFIEKYKKLELDVSFFDMTQANQHSWLEAM